MRGHQAGESKAGRKSWVRSRTFPRFWALLGSVRHGHGDGQAGYRASP